MALAVMYALTLVGFPLVSTLPTLLGLDSQLATIPYRMLVAGLAVGILYGWWVRGTPVLFNSAVLVTLTLWALLIARMFWDTIVSPLPGELYTPAAQLLLLSLGGCFLPALVALEPPSDEVLDQARRWIELLGALAMVAILYVGLRGVLAGSVLYRLATPVLNPISVGHLGVSVMIVALCGYAGAGRTARIWRALLVALSVGVTVATVSRGPILAGLLAVLILAFVGRRRGRIGLKGIVLRVSVLAIGVAGVVFAVLYLEETGVIDFLARLTDTFQDVASQERARMIRGAWTQFTEHPMLGSAFVELQFMENPHNIVLESLMALGVVGLGLLLVSMGASLAAAGEVIRSAPRHAWVGLVYLQYVVNGMLSGSLFTDHAFWFFGLASLALAKSLAARAGGG
jgi:O-antigen ligase